MIVNEVKFEDRVIKLCPNSIDSDSNIFTILVGRDLTPNLVPQVR